METITFHVDTNIVAIISNQENTKGKDMEPPERINAIYSHHNQRLPTDSRQCNRSSSWN